ncbi:MAG: Drug resistance transporter Bcr/CflA subfamily [Polaromonas sp.]|nr:Drug resistance transporter Bcr/CflA subfamily [Polaromonas sp.]
MPVSPPQAAPLSPSSGVAQVPMSAGLVVLMLAMLLGIQPVTTDLYLPALPALTQGFGAGMPQAQLTLSALLLAFGVSQLIWGPLSDRFGRRPILLWGLSAYTLASVGSTLSPTMAQLICWRVVQGAAMGAAVMCGRAIVRDLYRPADGARIMSKGLSGLALIATVCAPLGGLLSELFGWQAVLMCLAVFGALTLGVVAWRFQETLAHRNPLALQPVVLLRTWHEILGNPAFLAFTALSSASYAGLFTFLGGSSFIFIQVLGLSRAQYGLVMLATVLSYLAGTFACRQLLRRFSVRGAVMVAAGLSLAGGTAMGVLAWAGVQNVWSILVPQAMFMVAHGVHQPCGQAGAVGPFPRAAGAASAMNGFLMTAVAFGMGAWLGTRMDGTVAPLANGIWFWSVVLAVMAWTLVRRYGQVRPDPVAGGTAPALP